MLLRLRPSAAAARQVPWRYATGGTRSASASNPCASWTSLGHGFDGQDEIDEAGGDGAGRHARLARRRVVGALGQGESAMLLDRLEGQRAAAAVEHDPDRHVVLVQRQRDEEDVDRVALAVIGLGPTRAADRPRSSGSRWEDEDVVGCNFLAVAGDEHRHAGTAGEDLLEQAGLLFRWVVTTNASPPSAGIDPNRRWRASRPPAEAPTSDDRESGWSCPWMIPRNQSTKLRRIGSGCHGDIVEAPARSGPSSPAVAPGTAAAARSRRAHGCRRASATSSIWYGRKAVSPRPGIIDEQLLAHGSPRRWLLRRVLPQAPRGPPLAGRRP